jgi:hypothetical protein
MILWFVVVLFPSQCEEQICKSGISECVIFSFYQSQCFCENNTASLKGLGHEVEFKYVDRNEQFYR